MNWYSRDSTSDADPPRVDCPVDAVWQMAAASLSRGTLMGDNILDELIAMAEQLSCCGEAPTSEEAMREWQQRYEKFRERVGRETAEMLRPYKYSGCPHCLMLKRLRQLKAEAEQLAKGYGQTRQFTEEW